MRGHRAIEDLCRGTARSGKGANAIAAAKKSWPRATDSAAAETARSEAQLLQETHDEHATPIPPQEILPLHRGGIKRSTTRSQTLKQYITETGKIVPPDHRPARGISDSWRCGQRARYLALLPYTDHISVAEAS
jgi:hypothetical protein